MYTEGGYIHRDLKPENIFIKDLRGNIKSDFNLDPYYLSRNKCILKIGDLGFVTKRSGE
jgi:serine/threonine protein kinase